MAEMRISSKNRLASKVYRVGLVTHKIIFLVLKAGVISMVTLKIVFSLQYSERTLSKNTEKILQTNLYLLLEEINVLSVNLVT
jgi:hypothetical protein